MKDYLSSSLVVESLFNMWTWRPDGIWKIDKQLLRDCLTRQLHKGHRWLLELEDFVHLKAAGEVLEENQDTCLHCREQSAWTMLCDCPPSSLLQSHSVLSSE